ncbi:MAG TPA: response regulator [Bryobacteraceae bacterium]|jgi:CheY-like chemotaxis protein
MSQITLPSFSEVVLAVRIGQNNMARKLLRTILDADPNHEQALLWSAALADSIDEAGVLLERVLAINPGNKEAFNTLSMLRLHQLSGGGGIRATRAPQAGAQKALAAPQQPGTSSSSSTPSAVVESWTCPLCEVHVAGAMEKCHSCGAVQDPNDLDSIATNDRVDETLLLRAISKWKMQEQSRPTAEGQFILGLAYLNLHRSADAIPHLKQGLELAPDPDLRETVRRLEMRKTLLVVDDSSTVRRFVAIIAERRGWRITTAADGEEALRWLQGETPDLMLLDVMMPGLSGYQVCQAVRKMGKKTQLPVILFSGGFLDRIKGKLAGVTDYLAKPFEAEALTKLLGRYN